jgi:hypothetical protein
LRSAPLFGMATIVGSSPFPLIDFRRNADVLALFSETGPDNVQHRLLSIRNITLANLPVDVGADMGPLGALTSMLWIASVRQGAPRNAEPMYELLDVEAIVDCSEISFMARFLERLKVNSVGKSDFETDFVVWLLSCVLM